MMMEDKIGLVLREWKHSINKSKKRVKQISEKWDYHSKEYDRKMRELLAAL